jgi:K+-transporting ATPase A subunit
LLIFQDLMVDGTPGLTEVLREFAGQSSNESWCGQTAAFAGLSSNESWYGEAAAFCEHCDEFLLKKKIS